MSVERTAQPDSPSAPAASGPGTWVNWGGNQSFEYERIDRPADEDQVVALVERAAAAGGQLRVAGAGHSFSPLVQTNGILADLSSLSGVLRVDREQRQVTVGPATTIGELGPLLWEHGLALANQGDIDTQSIAGAAATATHGSGVALTSFSGTVSGARVVSGGGEAVVLDGRDLDSLHAFQVSLGMLGVVTELTLDVVDSYCLHEQRRLLQHDEVIERWDELLTGHRHFSFFWLPADGSAALYQLETPPDTDVADNCYVKIYDELEPEAVETAEAAPGERIDRGYRIYPHVFEPDWHELEYMVPIESGREALSRIRSLVKGRHPDKVFPVEVRFTRSEQGMLSPNFERDTVVFSVTGSPGTDYWPWFRDFDATLAPFGARAHWGKIHFMTRERVADVYPRYGDFCRVRERLDPQRIFLNDHLRSLFGPL